MDYMDFEKDLRAVETNIPGLIVFDLPVHGDNRGWFKENWQRAKMTALGLPDFGPVQNNISFNAKKGVTRGIHAEPWDKYISIATGSVFGDAAPDMYDSWHLDYPRLGRTAPLSCGCSTVDYDPSTRTATYFLQIDDLGGDVPAGAFKFSFNKLLIGKVEQEDVPVTADLSAVPKNAPTENHEINGLSTSDISLYETMHDYDFLVPQGTLWQSENGICALIAAGWRNGELHLHYRTDGSLSLDNHADFSTLHLADGTELMCDYTVTYKDFDNDIDYTEYVFPMAYEDVAGCTLTGDLYTASNLMDGRWAVSFRLTQ